MVNITTLLAQNISHYDADSETQYIYTPSHQQRIRLVVGMIRQFFGNKKIKCLSIGCASGVIEQELKKEFDIELHGLDASPACINRLKEFGIDGKVADVGQGIPYPDNHFDLVFAGELIEHLVETKKFLDEVYRILKKGGLLVLTTPNLAAISERFKFFFGYSPKHVNPLHPYYGLHVRPFTFKMLKQCLKNSSFEVEDFSSNILEILMQGKVRFKSRRLGNLFPDLGSTLIVSAKKV